MNPVLSRHFLLNQLCISWLHFLSACIIGYVLIKHVSYSCFCFSLVTVWCPWMMEAHQTQVGSTQQLL